MEDGALTLERLEEELLGDEDDHATTVAATMPPPPLPPGSTSQPPLASMRGGHAGSSLGCGSVATRDENPAPFVHEHRQHQKKLDISRGKRKHP